MTGDGKIEMETARNRDSIKIKCLYAHYRGRHQMKEKNGCSKMKEGYNI